MAVTNEPDRGVSNDPAEWLEEHGDYLLAKALRMVRSQDEAEDLVQDTLLAAMH
jgi:DNA-directed RNA polymerase specialized sigma24 family protein